MAANFGYAYNEYRHGIGYGLLNPVAVVMGGASGWVMPMVGQHGCFCLQGNYTAAAKELIVHTYFFSAGRDVLPKVSLHPDPLLRGTTSTLIFMTQGLRKAPTIKAAF